jgi:protein SCO1/2
MPEDKKLPPSDLNSSQVKWIWAILIVALLGISIAFIWKGFSSEKKQPQQPLPVLGQLRNFSLMDEMGNPFGTENLKGKIWIADFVFTRCAGPCPTMTLTMSKIEKSLRTSDDIRLVTFSVDPEFDTPEVLKAYSKSFSTKPNLWTFLTGNTKLVRQLAIEDFKIPLEISAPKPAVDDSSSILHSTHFVLIDGKGRIRGYYDSSDPQVAESALTDAHRLLRTQRALPTLNAILNSSSTILLLAAYRAVRRRRYALHRTLMYAALCTSAAFLTSYLTYHFAVQLTKHYEGPYPPVYFTILITHTFLAMGVLPLVLTTVAFALKGQKLDPSLSSLELSSHFSRHAKIARWTFPIWLYVSFTGVIVYLMLYQLPKLFAH